MLTDKNTNKLCEKLMYLIGVPAQHIDNFDNFGGIFADVRRLCALRNDIIEKTPALYELRRNGDAATAIAIEETGTLIQRMAGCGFNMFETVSLYQCVIMLNEEIDKAVSSAVLNINEIPFPWIAELFHMPDGDTIEGVKAAVRKYHKFRRYFPYQKWLNWDFASTPETKRSKNILRDDNYFIALIGEAHTNKSQLLIDFAERHDTLTVVANCENSDPQRLYNSLRTIENKLHKLILINDAHSNALWDELEKDFAANGINVEHLKTARLKKEKSLADYMFVGKTCEAYYRDGIRSFVLASSDSDMWSLRLTLPDDADIMVLAEKCKCGDVLVDTLTQNNTPYAFMEDTQTDTTELMDRVVYKEMEYMAEKYREKEHPLNMRRIVLNAISRLNIYPSDETLERYIEGAAQLFVTGNEQNSVQGNPGTFLMSTCLSIA